MESLLTVSLLLGLSSLLAHQNLRLLLQVVRGPLIRVLLWPGVAIHEAGHLLMCKLTGTRVVAVHTFLYDGGEVIHEQPQSRLVQVLISFGPLLTGVAAILSISYILAPELLSLTGTPQELIVDLVKVSVAAISNIKGILFLLLILSVATTLSPSKEDLLNAFPGLVLIVTLGAAVLIITAVVAPQSLPTPGELSLGNVGPLWLVMLLELILLITLTVLVFLRRLSRR